jgi:hypothetical protein
MIGMAFYGLACRIAPQPATRENCQTRFPFQPIFVYHQISVKRI